MSAHQYYMSEGQLAGFCMELTLYFYCAHPQFSFQFLSLPLLSISAHVFYSFNTISNHSPVYFQPSVSAPIKSLEVVKLWAGLYKGASGENLSLAL